MEMNDTHRTLSLEGFHFIGCCVSCRVYPQNRGICCINSAVLFYNPCILENYKRFLLSIRKTSLPLQQIPWRAAARNMRIRLHIVSILRRLFLL